MIPNNIVTCTCIKTLLRLMAEDREISYINEFKIYIKCSCHSVPFIENLIARFYLNHSIVSFYSDHKVTGFCMR